MKVLNYEELDYICGKAIERCGNHQPELMSCLQLMQAFGIRANESYELNRWEINFNSTCVLHASKESNTRYFNWNDLPANWKAYATEPGRMEKYVNYRRMQYHLENSISRYQAKVGGKDLVTHIFRYAFVKYLVWIDKTPAEIQSLIGHKSLSSTERYISQNVIAPQSPYLVDFPV
jgi:site-specific recombinase XerD